MDKITLIDTEGTPKFELGKDNEVIPVKKCTCKKPKPVVGVCTVCGGKRNANDTRED